MAPRGRTAPPRAARRSALAALTAALLAASSAAPATAATAPPQPYLGQVTDALRTPAHRLLADPATGRAPADLVFLDRETPRTAYRACVTRRDDTRLRTCYSATTGRAGVATVTPLRFPRGRYAVSWSVDGETVARWRFTVL
jgi:hypothetical protein